MMDCSSIHFILNNINHQVLGELVYFTKKITTITHNHAGTLKWCTYIFRQIIPWHM